MIRVREVGDDEWSDVPAVHMRVTEPERAGMERAAAREGLRLSTWLRRLALLESRRSEGAEARRDVPRGPA